MTSFRRLLLIVGLLCVLPSWAGPNAPTAAAGVRATPAERHARHHGHTGIKRTRLPLTRGLVTRPAVSPKPGSDQAEDPDDNEPPAWIDSVFDTAHRSTDLVAAPFEWTHQPADVAAPAIAEPSPPRLRPRTSPTDLRGPPSASLLLA